MIQDAFWGVLIPFLGTSLGAGCVFFLKNSLSDGIQRALTGFAAGVMVAASVWSLLIPAMEQAADLGRLAFFPAAAGFWLGVLFLLLLDHLIPHLHQNSLQAEGPKSQLQRTTMMVLAVTLHNIPEGMAVGLSFALARREWRWAWSMPGILPGLLRSPPPGRWYFPLALPSRTSRRVPSSPCRCGRKE